MCSTVPCTHAHAVMVPALQAFELRLWPEQHPLRQFEQQLRHELLRKLEDRQISLDMLAVRLSWQGCSLWVKGPS